MRIKSLNRVASLGVALLFVFAVTGACKRSRPAGEKGAEAEPAAKATALVAVDERALPGGPSVAAPLLRQKPSREDCVVACDIIVAAEAERHLQATPDEAQAGVRGIFEVLKGRERAGCVKTCRARLSRAVTECLRLTGAVDKAVDCLTRTGGAGAAETPKDRGAKAGERTP